ncbi:hypothetical protein [Bythopirellula goksoeyrii]|uniref:Uncharacterized protein n=1 Tax=Bythopirellula goksoeyrii TaxID=1400387 RepID=A0A5B9QAZ8_9BACT|nr:hypothetical protein [Bythopirellula goksoeyrii]QEG36234.1 hypothetical protein Pr1d_35460 [Bythopirellula goksoeyrii]
MELVDWHIYLENHYACLRSARTLLSPDRPIFALEHGLDKDQRTDLATAIRNHIASDTPSGKHALAWIAYASEIGYGYAGDEFWQTFEDETPGWSLNGDRDWLRRRFQSFAKDFGGAQPTGRWADHFSIICWPITHAILPCDLQRQLARVLYELRHSFSAELFESPMVLGDFISSRSWNSTSRFKNFSQAKQLVGQIATALLLGGDPGFDNLLYAPTLKRIGEDLDQERRAREWLRGARKFAHERAQVRGLSLVKKGGLSGSRRPQEARAQIAALGIEPRAILKPVDVAGATWSVALELPDLSSLLFRFPTASEVLTNSRCVIAGTSIGPRARGWCLGGPRVVTLTRWPKPDEVLIQFDNADPSLEFLLCTECLLRPGPLWLFRIATDGLAYVARSLKVRPGNKYILLRSTDTFAYDDMVRPITVNCEGVTAALIDLPSALDSTWDAKLEALGVTRAKAIEVWPVGLSAVVWDGEGHGEWLASERPTLAICSDHHVGALLLGLDSSSAPMEIAPVVPGEPIFIALPELPVGLHTVHVATRSANSGDIEDLGELDIVMRIRDARPWSPGVSPHGPLLVSIDPPVPTLEQLWEGRTEIAIEGPAGRRAKCQVSLSEKKNGPPSFAERLPALQLPVSPDAWSRHFERHFRQKPGAEAAYDAARHCEIAFTAEELGEFVVSAEREFSPLRWTVRRDGRRYIVRLINDSGNSTPPTITYSSFETPAVFTSLANAPEYLAEQLGGLYSASLNGFTSAVIVPPTPVFDSFGALTCSPTIGSMPRSVESVCAAIGVAHSWMSASLPGGILSAKWRREVLVCIIRHILQLIGGDNWARADVDDISSTFAMSRLKDAVTRRGDEAAIGAVISRDCSLLSSQSCRQRIERLTYLAQRYLSLKASVTSKPQTADASPKGATDTDPQWLSELALRLASEPGSAIAWAGDNLRNGVKRLIEEVPTLARAARYLVITTDHHLDSDTSGNEIYASWKWI